MSQPAGGPQVQQFWNVAPIGYGDALAATDTTTVGCITLVPLALPGRMRVRELAATIGCNNSSANTAWAMALYKATTPLLQSPTDPLASKRPPELLLVPASTKTVAGNVRHAVAGSTFSQRFNLVFLSDLELDPDDAQFYVALWTRNAQGLWLCPATTGGAALTALRADAQLSLTGAPGPFPSSVRARAAAQRCPSVTLRSTLGMYFFGSPSDDTGTAATYVPSGLSDITLADNTNPAFRIHEAANNYVVISTTDGAENISLGNAVTNPSFSFLGTGTTTFSGPIAASNWLLADNTAGALRVREGANDYVNITTTDGAESVSFGNTTTNPSYAFLGSGTVTFSGPLSLSNIVITDNVANAFRLRESANDYLNVNTTNAAEVLAFGNTTTNPSYGFLGTGNTTFGGSLVMPAAFFVGAGSHGTLGANAVALGNVALAAGSSGIAIGNGATATNPDNIAIGRATTTGASASGDNVCIGRSNTVGAACTGGVGVGVGHQIAGSKPIAIGNGALANATQVIAIGASANVIAGAFGSANAIALGTASLITNSTGGIAIGNRATLPNASHGSIVLGSDVAATAGGQFVVGSKDGVISQIYVGGDVSTSGGGVTAIAPSGVTIQPSGASGANVAGATWTVAGGKSTGSAVGGAVLVKTSPAGGAGSAQNALSTVATFGADAALTTTLAGALAVTGISTFTGAATFNSTVAAANLLLTDNTASALRVREAANDYLNVTTTDGAENVSFGNATTNPSYTFLGSGTITINGSLSLSAILLTDNLASALRIREGGNDYLKVVTTNAAESVKLGNATTNPSFAFLGTGVTTFGGSLVTPSSFYVGPGAHGTPSNGAVAIGDSATVNGYGVALGSSAGATGVGAVAIGWGASATGNEAVALGYLSSATAQDAVALGDSAAASALGAIAIGLSATVSGAEAVGIGYNVSVAHQSIALGFGTTTSAAGQLIIGQQNASGITDIYFGGYTPIAWFGAGAAAGDVSLQPSGVTGANIAGASLLLAAGKGTGNATPGSVLIRVAQAGGAGSTLQSLTTIATFAPTNLLTTLAGSLAMPTAFFVGAGAHGTLGANAVALGNVALAAGDQALSWGYGASAGFAASIALGPAAVTSKANQVMLGDPAGTYPLTEQFWPVNVYRYTIRRNKDLTTLNATPTTIDSYTFPLVSGVQAGSILLDIHVAVNALTAAQFGVWHIEGRVELNGSTVTVTAIYSSTTALAGLWGGPTVTVAAGVVTVTVAGGAATLANWYLDWSMYYAA